MRDFNDCKAMVDHVCTEHAGLQRALQAIEAELHADEKQDPASEASRIRFINPANHMDVMNRKFSILRQLYISKNSNLGL